MKKFCENPLCIAHVDYPLDEEMFLVLNWNDHTVRIRRFRVQTDDGREFAFCASCVNVLSLTYGKTNEQKEQSAVETPALGSPDRLESSIQEGGAGNPT